MRYPGLIGLWFCVACGGGGGGGGGDDQKVPDAATEVDAAIDAPAAMGADIATTLQCGPTPPNGTGGMAELQKITFDTTKFPDALCNDGTTAFMYIRPAADAANRNRWQINLHGGGGCASGPTCAARWCSCDSLTKCPFAASTTNFDRTNMTAFGNMQKVGDGLFARGGTGPMTNPLGDYNLVELKYCSSDGWHGNAKNVAMMAANPVTGVQVTYRINFLGAKILDAALATLRQDGVGAPTYTLAGANTPMPDLDAATEVVLTGDSAGGSGVISNLDYVRDTLRAQNPALSIYGLIDAIVGPDVSLLDFGAYVDPTVRSYDQYLTAREASPVETGARRDASCLAIHATDPRICGDESHILRNHITTPFFVRAALRDQLVSASYIGTGLRNPDMSPMTVMSFSTRLHDELTAFPTLATTAEEGAMFTKAPGVFAPGCTNHDTIHSDSETFGTTITPPGGIAQRVVGVFEHWLTGSGTPTNILTESPTLADTNCP